MIFFPTCDLTGLWLGSYGYQPSAEFPIRQPDVPFTYSIRQGLFGRIRGIVDDDRDRGIPVTAQTWGWVSGNRLRFRKQYPVCYVQDGMRMLPLTEFWRAQGLPVDHEIVPDPIDYEGTLDEVEGTIQGTWRIPPGTIRAVSRGQSFEIPCGNIEGTWQMERESQEGAARIHRDS